MGIGCSYHPYECSHDKYCEHCTLAETDWHDPKECALCDWMDNGDLVRMCDEPFATRIRVDDYSYRKLKVFVSSIKQTKQEELPF